jgi:hypothetical protein
MLRALMVIYLAGVSLRRVEDITKSAVGPGCRPPVSDLNKKIEGKIELSCNRPIEGEHPRDADTVGLVSANCYIAVTASGGKSTIRRREAARSDVAVECIRG